MIPQTTTAYWQVLSTQLGPIDHAHDHTTVDMRQLCCMRDRYMSHLHVIVIHHIFNFFLIVRRPWPNFVCKGRHTSSVVLVLVCVIDH